MAVEAGSYYGTIYNLACLLLMYSLTRARGCLAAQVVITAQTEVPSGVGSKPKIEVHTKIMGQQTLERGDKCPVAACERSG
jgi:hypothetical protein